MVTLLQTLIQEVVDLARMLIPCWDLSIHSILLVLVMLAHFNR